MSTPPLASDLDRCVTQSTAALATVICSRPGRVAHLEAPLYAAAQSHFATKRWEGNCPLTPANDTYSAELYGELAHATLMEYDETAQDAPPLFCAQRRPSFLRLFVWGASVLPNKLAVVRRLG